MMRLSSRKNPYIEAADFASLPTSLSDQHLARTLDTGDIYIGDGSGGWNLFGEYKLNWLGCESSVQVGDPVYWHQETGSYSTTGSITPTGEVRVASADQASTAGVVGVAVERHASQNLVRVAGNGSYAGVAGPLATGQPYYLGEGTGNIVATPPSELGWVQLGVARSSTEIDIFIHPYGILPQ